jgi:hypothetical protein
MYNILFHGGNVVKTTTREFHILLFLAFIFPATIPTYGIKKKTKPFLVKL